MAISPIERKVTAIVSHDKLSGLYTFSLLEKGGPIVMAKTEELGKIKFEEALNVASAVRNLKYFTEKDLARKVETVRTNSTNSHDIEYRHLQVA